MRTESSQIFSEINEFLSKNKSSILLAYSPVHLQDLKKSYFNSDKGKIETEKDLEFLGNLTSNHCLCYNFETKRVYPDIISPVKYFQKIYVENENDILCDFENIFSTNDLLGNLWQSYWKFLTLIPSGIDFSHLEQLPKEYQGLNDLFKSTKKNNTLGNLLKDMLNVLQNVDDFEKIFKTIRTNSNKDLKIKTDNSTWGNPFDYLDKVLKKSKLQKSFFELSTEFIEKSNKNATRFEYFLNYYIQLDMFGYHKDKKLLNLINDASHSFYGAHTDIFVTDDDNTNNKSIALYRQLNIETEVISSSEFINCIRRMKLFKSEKTLLEQVGYLIENSLLLLDSFDDNLKPARVYLVKPVLMDYFNRMQISDFENSVSLIFYKKQGNYSQIMFWTEIESVVNKVVNEFGIDLNNRESFQENEKSEIIENKWKGRIWSFDRIEIVMIYTENLMRLTINIEM